MRLPSARGPISEGVLTALSDDAAVESNGGAGLLRRYLNPVNDEDLHLALWVLYELHYRGFDEVPDEREWDTDLLRLRAELETVFEGALRSSTAAMLTRASSYHDDVVAQLERLVGTAEGSDLTRFVQREASISQFHDLLIQRSIYTLKEADPVTFVLPRLEGAAKAALAELQYDEYGAGRAEGLHATLYANSLRGCDLKADYGAYIDQTDGATLAVNNAASMFGLHRRLRGAMLGHLAAFEMTSSLPCRRLVSGAQRLGMPKAVWHYFDEHIEADSVHEQLALHQICGAAVIADPGIGPDVLFGAAVCLELEGAAQAALLERWRAAAHSSAPVHQRCSA